MKNEKLIINMKKLLAITVALLTICFFSIAFQPLDAAFASYEEMHENAQQGSLAELDFTIDSGGYFAGTIAVEEPTFVLSLIGSAARPQDTEFYFIEQDNMGAPDINEQWMLITKDQLGDNYATYVPAMGTNMYFKKYVYFKTIITKLDPVTAQVTYEYHKIDIPTEIIIDKNINYDIKGVTATYRDAGGAFINYDSSETAPFVSTAIRYNLLTDVQGLTGITYQYYYEGATAGTIDGPWISMSGTSITLDAANAQQINGQIHFRAFNSNENSYVHYFAVETYARLDTVSPEFIVNARKQTSGATYPFNSWSNENVIYSLIPDPQKTPNVCEVKYYYWLGGEYIEIIPTITNNIKNYEVLITQTAGTLRFRAVSDAGLEYRHNDENFYTPIDKVTPQVHITATDRDSTVIKSVGTEPSASYRVGYASGRIDFVIRNSDVNGVPVPNTSTITYEYSDDGGVTYKALSLTGGLYRLTIDGMAENIYDKVIIFRLTSRSGLSSTQTFEVNILKPNFIVEMDDLSPDTNDLGWASEDIMVDFYIADGNYIFYAEIAGAGVPKQQLTKVQKGNVDSEGIRHFQVTYDIPVNNAAIIFSVENLAGDTTVLSPTQAIRLDNVVPNAQITGVVQGSMQPIYSGDWSNGKVVLTVTPEINLSGIKIEYVYANGLGEQLSQNQLGLYTITISNTTTSVFRLTSGSGLQKEISFNVNIDLSDIDIDIINYDYLLQTVFSQDVLVEFATNHTGAYTVWYKELGVNENFIQTLNQFFVVPVANEIAQGTKQFVFYLETKAVDKNGLRKRSDEMPLSIQYNRTPSSIEVFRYNDDGNVVSGAWVKGTVIFSITTLANHTYQASFNDGVWKNIAVDDDNTPQNNRLFYFAGLSSGGNIYYSPDLNGNFSGSVSIRAINNAGYPSNVIRLDNVRIDNSIPQVVNAISLPNGMGEISTVDRRVFSGENILLRGTNSLPGFSQYAPIVYYYQSKTSPTAPIAPTPGSLGSWQEVQTGNPFVLQSTGEIWLYATNSLGTSSLSVESYSFIIDRNGLTFNVTYPPEAGSLNQANIFEYIWSTSSIDVLFTTVSATNVYYWYTTSTASVVPEADWILISTEGSVPSGTFTYTHFDDTMKTFRFRATSRAGYEVIAQNRAVIRIDNVDPTFNVEYRSGGVPYIGNTWAKEAIAIKITPTAVNPGGVIYEYYFNGVWSRVSSLNFSTDMIDNFGVDQNGEGIFMLSATSVVNNKRYISDEIIIRVDKIVPNFNLVGELSNNVTITSGQWSNESQVNIAVVRNSTNISGVTFYHHKGDGELKEVDDLISIDTSSVITVVAVTGSGLTLSKNFVVNIDTIAPRIDAGKIVNAAPGAPPNQYYVDQVIYYIEENVKIAEYNGYSLVNGMEISTKNVDTNLNGYVHIIIEDLAGNRTELKFYMMPFPLNINNVTLSAEDLALIDTFQDELDAAINLSASRRAYFANQIATLRDRVIILQGQVDDFHNYLEIINGKNSFELNSDYDQMKRYMDRYNNYPTWQQNYITDNSVKPYDIYFTKLLTQFQALDILMANVRLVEAQIAALPAINVVKKSDYVDVKRVHNYYESLSVAQKSKLKSTLRAKLMELLRLCELMLLQDELTGVKIAGDNLAGGLEIEVTPFARSTTKFIDAQRSLIEAIAANEGPRAIAAIYQMTLAGDGSSTITGDITITIPIPEDYVSYIAFAVYKLNPNGTIVKMQGVEIAADGKSVSFVSSELATYILAANANIERTIQDTTLYGMIGNIIVDSEMLQYIAIAVAGLFGITIIILVIGALKRRAFLKRYNNDYKRSLTRRGIDTIPKGNPAPRRNPSNPEERFSYKRKPIHR